MGMLNVMSHAALTRWDVFDENKGINPTRLSIFMAGTEAGLVEMTMTSGWLTDYLKNNWDGAANSAFSCREMRKILGDCVWDEVDPETGEIKVCRNEGFGIFEFTPVFRGTTVEPPTLKHFNIAKALIFYRIADHELRRRLAIKFPDDNPYDHLPEHKGRLMVNLWNALLCGFCDYEGNVFNQGVEFKCFVSRNPVEAVVFTINWVWDKSMKIVKKAWNVLRNRKAKASFLEKYGIRT